MDRVICWFRSSELLSVVVVIEETHITYISFCFAFVVAVLAFFWISLCVLALCSDMVEYKTSAPSLNRYRVLHGARLEPQSDCPFFKEVIYHWLEKSWRNIILISPCIFFKILTTSSLCVLLSTPSNLANVEYYYYLLKKACIFYLRGFACFCAFCYRSCASISTCASFAPSQILFT